MLRFFTAGESHGQALVAIVEGMPAGVPLVREQVNRHLARRQGGYGRGNRQKIERDEVEFLSGVRHGETLGSPIALLIRNRDWSHWTHIMSPDPPGAQPGVDSPTPGAGAAQVGPARIVTRPRPGHADLNGSLKYDRADARDVLERASARETAARVAAGAVARALLEPFGVRLVGHVVQIGPIAASRPTGQAAALAGDLGELAQAAEASPVRCADPEASAAMVAEIDRARADRDSLGGIVEVVAAGLPPGLGSHVSWDRKLDGRIAAAVMSVQAVKGVEIGLGFEAARRRGSAVHDEIFWSRERGFYRGSNNAGGTEGGMTTGEPLVLRAALKPISTLYRPLRTVDMKTKEPLEAAVERSDTCAVPAGAVIVEHAVAFELARAWLEKFGGDSLREVRRNWEGYLAQVRAF